MREEKREDSEKEHTGGLSDVDGEISRDIECINGVDHVKTSREVGEGGRDLDGAVRACGIDVVADGGETSL
jgi:hypothetical protein